MQRVVAIVRERSEESARQAMARLLTAGARVIEVSLTTPGAISVIDEFSNHPDVLVGAGTVMSVRQVSDVAAAGAAFCLSPILDPDIVAAVHARGMEMMPAAMTPTEAVLAVRLGAEAVKVFPASAWSPDIVRDVRQALPDLCLVPTGGVRVSDVDAWWDAGALAVGLGGALKKMADDDLRSLLQRASSAHGCSPTPRRPRSV
ncbi:bifunctional 4-hydroxy-2-oxoglutarate aldolase/2-dehydro-3-deoxy-phosphogluconate aldolase [Microbacterium sp. NC79]|uniref:bifunctional 4-hydroxy-2-oxoglutarate aldolase/2-dehydro-3-deoxy-phosphogluconate aldolase n=1 Tax=Microbacterium sp. NC79 TaxID=2851009 RepID=UPI001C2C8156|nr:bifunctional 4-hydroxy-2-oxoglutarate aldolase/2-dehydro-3-deoxy-phosphogluconate aldolase [Microbacterium sp. NC79]